MNLIGLFRSQLVRLSTDSSPATAERHRSVPATGEDHQRRKGELLEEPLLVNTWERDGRGEHSRAVVEAVDPESVDVDPLKYL